MSMPAFAAAMQGIMGANVGPNPVSDETGLKGAWDFDLKFSFNLNGPLMMMNGAAVERYLVRRRAGKTTRSEARKAPGSHARNRHRQRE